MGAGSRLENGLTMSLEGSTPSPSAMQYFSHEFVTGVIVQRQDGGVASRRWGFESP